METRVFNIKGSVAMFIRIQEREPQKVDYSSRGYALDKVEFAPASNKMTLTYKYWRLPLPFLN